MTLRLALGLLRGDPAAWMAWHCMRLNWHRDGAVRHFEAVMKYKRIMEGK